MPETRSHARALFALTALAALLLCWPASARRREPQAAAEPRVFHVTVTDRKGNLLAGLRREDLSVTERGEPREIVSFAAPDAPASVMFLVDASASAFGLDAETRRPWRVDALKDAVSAFVERGNPSNEYSVTAFNQSPQVLLDGSKDGRAVAAALDRLSATSRKGKTAFHDALYLSLNKLAQRPAGKRVLVLLSDGMDNVSGYSARDVVRALKESDVIVYAVAVFAQDTDPVTHEALRFMAELADLSGGLVFYPVADVKGLRETLALIAAELRAQYEVAVAAPARAQAKGDGWRGFKFKLAEVRDAGGRKVKAVVRARAGFYEPSAARK